MTSLSKRTGRNVRDARKAMGLTQRQLANLANVAEATVSRLELGKTEYPRGEEFERVADALGTTTERLVGLGAEPDRIPPAPLPSASESDATIKVLTDEEEALHRAFRGNLRQIGDFMIQAADLEEHDRRLVIDAVEWAKARIEAAHAWERQRRARVEAETIVLEQRSRDPAGNGAGI